MRNDAVVSRARVKIERYDMNLVTLRDQAPGKLPAPVFQPASRRIEAFENQPYFHGDNASRRLRASAAEKRMRRPPRANDECRMSNVETVTKLQ